MALACSVDDGGAQALKNGLDLLTPLTSGCLEFLYTVWKRVLGGCIEIKVKLD
jgi:hypothetical protein